MNIKIAFFVLGLMLLVACRITPTEAALAPLECTPPVVPGEYTVILRDQADALSLANKTIERYGGELFRIIDFAFTGFDAALPDEAVNALRKHPDVERIQCNLLTSPPG
ncbi:MAG: hypothetical protein M3498_18220 [Deinococcota bacterium]|jgi:hypothetical protein|nr:hypothetical protein [Deinococcota bacterium]